MSKLLTTREAAEMLGVGTTSVKRWADSGVLRCVKTPGGHRRFPLPDIEAMLREARGDDGPLPAIDADNWVGLLIRGTDPHEVYRRLSDERDRAGAWWRVCESMAEVLVDIGNRWMTGEITVLQEHLASERLARALARCAEEISPPPAAPQALLVAAEGDDHTLGLSLAELVLRESGWITRWAGTRTPRPALENFLAAGEVQLVAVSAAASVTDQQSLADQADWFGETCRRAGAELVFGGAGAWPERLGYGHRLTSFEQLSRLAADLAATSRH
jgi:excisionase family DNA binding protein